MVNYLVILFISYLIAGYGLYRLYKRRQDPDVNEGIDWIKLHKKRLKWCSIALFVIVTLLLSKFLWKTASCQIDGWSYNTDTEYSWIKGQCLYTTANGAKLPLGVTRDRPDGKNTDSQDSTDTIY